MILLYQFKTQLFVVATVTTVTTITTKTTKITLKLCIFSPHSAYRCFAHICAICVRTFRMYDLQFWVSLSSCFDNTKWRAPVFRDVTLRYGVIYCRRFERACMHGPGNLDVSPKRRRYLSNEAVSRRTESDCTCRTMWINLKICNQNKICLQVQIKFCVCVCVCVCVVCVWVCLCGVCFFVLTFYCAISTISY